ncbi:alginate lyase family protein [Granulicella sp. dw_53]|uniref:alginate lyase family protein n=1 Tax=Granulicella sp. dw_53 TaxID=2719792 RepID=UPI0021043944|nr:alginate lyase family protein [Granulicella sp. dw_53]
MTLLIAVAPALFAAPTKPLRSPWDGRPVTVTEVAYACPAIVHIAPDLVTDGFYRLDDPTHSIIDPVRQEAYRQSSEGVKSVGAEIVRAADAYRTTGSKQAAQCAMNQIVTLAQEHSLAGKMSSSQAYYVQGWIAGAIAIAYLKIRETGLATPQQSEVIGAWLESIGKQTVAYYEEHNRSGHGTSQNNHLYWAGVELAAIGVAADNPSDFSWAMGTYNIGVDKIQPDGTLPLEMARGSRALHYHLYALAPLVLLAEFGEANHIDSYARANGAIHRLVNISVAGLHDPAPFAKAAKAQQEIPKTISGDQIGWAPPYVRRFPNPALEGFIKSAPSLSVFYLGGLPPG